MANESGNGVSVINGYTNHMSFVIPYKSKFKNGFIIGADVNPKTNMVYIFSQLENKVSVINGYTNKLVKDITVYGISPVALAVNPTTNMVYVANKH